MATSVWFNGVPAWHDGTWHNGAGPFWGRLQRPAPEVSLDRLARGW